MSSRWQQGWVQWATIGGETRVLGSAERQMTWGEHRWNVSFLCQLMFHDMSPVNHPSVFRNVPAVQYTVLCNMWQLLTNKHKNIDAIFCWMLLNCPRNQEPWHQTDFLPHSCKILCRLGRRVEKIMSLIWTPSLVCDQNTYERWSNYVKLLVFAKGLDKMHPTGRKLSDEGVDNPSTYPSEKIQTVWACKHQRPFLKHHISFCKIETEAILAVISNAHSSSY